MIRDIRSAAYARKWTRNYHDSGPRTRSVAGRKWWHAERRNDNKRLKRDTLRHSIKEAQERKQVFSGGKYKNWHFILWDLIPDDGFDEEIENMRDDVIRYEKMHWYNDIFERTDPCMEVGETFSIWAQRRIAEMRAVKEDRLRNKLPLVQRQVAFQSHQIRAMGIRQRSVIFDRSGYEVYPGSPNTTTLPTNDYDAYGHALLHRILTPTKWAMQQARFRPDVSRFPAVEGDGWFAAYTWGWHRNFSGCWEFGYGECDGTPIPCPCCCCGNGSMYFECHCKIFGNVSAPEEQQRCCLLEWVGEAGRMIITAEDSESGTIAELHQYVDVGSTESEWEFVEGSCGVQSCSSTTSYI